MGNGRYQKLLDYISYFEREDINFCTWPRPSQTDGKVIEMSYPIYDKGIDRFIKDVYESNLLINNYSEYLERHQIDSSKMKDYIYEADFEFLRAILTHSVRGERFCDGFSVAHHSMLCFKRLETGRKSMERYYPHR